MLVFWEKFQLLLRLGGAIEKVWTVSELTRSVKENLEVNFPAIWVEGEVSNYLLHTSGHRYFSLKDESAQLRCTIWRGAGQYLNFELEDGLKVHAFGNLTVYEKRGEYQLNVLKLLPIGRGELEIAFQKLKERLFKEGLFDEAHKKPIPEFPERIGIITSPTGAAVQDMLKIFRRRFPPAELYLYPARVQGEGAKEEIVAGIQAFNEWGEVDVMILGRGGGSLEDLWAFNEEEVARAIYASRIPVVSAVGHEIDFTIADFVADLRAPTPSAAVEMVVPDKEELEGVVKGLKERIGGLFAHQLAQAQARLDAVLGSYGLKKPADLVNQKSQFVDELSRRAQLALSNRLAQMRLELKSADERLATLSPRAVLARGYSIVRRRPDGRVVREYKEVKAGEGVELIFSKGKAEAEVTRTLPEE
ncbi:MAG: exodeoxyribonuclease VII large subunit [candidate division Zixibacteria bacterium]|nr:exodeoxyribonuclease VII large subunit [candidate division Zixibacteria bacterium]